MENQHKFKLIIFDLNKTLIRENTWRDLNLALGLTSEEDDMLMKWAEEGIINDQQGQDIICEVYKKRSTPTKETILNIIRNYNYNPGAKKVVEKIHSLGIPIAIISGAMDILVELVAKELNILYWQAGNHLSFDKNGILSKIITSKKDSLTKSQQLQQLCQKMAIKPQDCLVIGDGANDEEVFELSGNGVTFSGSKIEAKAKYVIKSLGEIPSLLG